MPVTLTRGVVLAVALALAVSGLVLVLHDVDLGPLGRPRRPRRSRRPWPAWRRRWSPSRRRRRAPPGSDRLAPGSLGDLVDLDDVADSDLLLPGATAHDRVHRGLTLVSVRRTRSARWTRAQDDVPSTSTAQSTDPARGGQTGGRPPRLRSALAQAAGSRLLARLSSSACGLLATSPGVRRASPSWPACRRLLGRLGRARSCSAGARRPSSARPRSLGLARSASSSALLRPLPEPLGPRPSDPCRALRGLLVRRPAASRRRSPPARSGRPPPRRRPPLRPVVVVLGRLHRVGVHQHAAALAGLTGLAERLQQPGADLLAGHLHEAERRHLGHLVPGPVAAEALHQPAQHQVAVQLEHHVDEVDDDDAADVAQPELADDLLGRLEVVPGHRLLEVAPRAGELAGVDVDDGHRLGAVDDQRAARRQEHLAVERLGDLLVDAVVGEHVVAVVPLQPLGQVGRDVLDVRLDVVPRVVALDRTASTKSSLNRSRTTLISRSGSP